MRRVIVTMLVIAVLLDVTYWTLWYAQRSWIASEHSAAYYAFENAFPLADAWLGISCVLALITLLREHRRSRFWVLCAGSAATYLFCMDFLYDVEHGIFAKGGGGATEAVIVALTLIFAVTLLAWSWRTDSNVMPSESGG